MQHEGIRPAHYTQDYNILRREHADICLLAVAEKQKTSYLLVACNLLWMEQGLEWCVPNQRRHQCVARRDKANWVFFDME